jgi:hypothetical protein
MRTLIMAAATAALFVTLSPVAHADPLTSDEQAYVQEIQRDGITVKSPQAAASVGHHICDLLTDTGGDEHLPMKALVASEAHLTMTQARTIVEASETYLCPFTIGGKS